MNPGFRWTDAQSRAAARLLMVAGRGDEEIMRCTGLGETDVLELRALAASAPFRPSKLDGSKSGRPTFRSGGGAPARLDEENGLSSAD